MRGPTTSSMAKVCPAWSLEIVENLERFTNLRVILAQGHANLLCIVPILLMCCRSKHDHTILPLG